MRVKQPYISTTSRRMRTAALRVRFLGTGPAGGRPGRGRSQRTESSLAVTAGSDAILIDTTRDFATQARPLDRVDLVLLTHPHRDVAGGVPRLARHERRQLRGVAPSARRGRDRLAAAASEHRDALADLVRQVGADAARGRHRQLARAVRRLHPVGLVRGRPGKLDVLDCTVERQLHRQIERLQRRSDNTLIESSIIDAQLRDRDSPLDLCAVQRKRSDPGRGGTHRRHRAHRQHVIDKVRRRIGHVSRDA